MEVVGQSEAAGTGDGQADRFVATTKGFQLLVDVFQQARHRGAYIGVVAPVIGEEHGIKGVGLIKHHGLHCGGTDIKTHTQRFRVTGFDRSVCCFDHVMYLYRSRPPDRVHTSMEAVETPSPRLSKHVIVVCAHA